MTRLLVLVLVLSLVGGSGLAAQAAGPASVVEDRELEYEAALSSYYAAYSAWEVLERRWNQLMDDQDSARRSGDDERIDRVLAEAQELSGQMTAAENRLHTQRGRWHAAGDALISALDGHLELLSEEAQRTPLGSQGDLIALYRDRDNRLREVEDQLGPRRTLVTLRPLPEVNIEERDGPREIEFKAKFLDRKADQHETLVADLTAEIDGLMNRQRRDRAFGDFLAVLDRFDDTQVPVTAETPRTAVPEEVAASDSTDVNAAPPTIEVRIEQLLLFRDEVVRRRDRLREKAELFRTRAGAIS